MTFAKRVQQFNLLCRQGLRGAYSSIRTFQHSTQKPKTDKIRRIPFGKVELYKDQNVYTISLAYHFSKKKNIHQIRTSNAKKVTPYPSGQRFICSQLD